MSGSPSGYTPVAVTDADSAIPATSLALLRAIAAADQQCTAAMTSVVKQFKSDFPTVSGIESTLATGIKAIAQDVKSFFKGNAATSIAQTDYTEGLTNNVVLTGAYNAADIHLEAAAIAAKIRAQLQTPAQIQPDVVTFQDDVTTFQTQMLPAIQAILNDPSVAQAASVWQSTYSTSIGAALGDIASAIINWGVDEAVQAVKHGVGGLSLESWLVIGFGIATVLGLLYLQRKAIRL